MTRVTERSFKKTFQLLAYKQGNRERQNERIKNYRRLVFLRSRIGDCTQCCDAPPQNRCLCGDVHVCNECVRKCIMYQVKVCPACS